MLRDADGAIPGTSSGVLRVDRENEEKEMDLSLAPTQLAFGPGWERSGYRPSTRFHPLALAGSLLAVCGFISALAWINVAPVFKARHDLLVVDLAATPPPPPRQPPAPRKHQDTPKPNQPPQIVAPPPIISVPSPQTVATRPQSDPAPIIAALAAPAAPAAPVPAPAPAVASAGDLSSTMISAKAPAYPLESRRRHEEGTVVLKLLLSTDGQVSDISIAQSSGSTLLDQAALTAVRKWRWKPMARNGEPVLVQGMVTIPFILKH